MWHERSSEVQWKSFTLAPIVVGRSESKMKASIEQLLSVLSAAETKFYIIAPILILSRPSARD